MLGLLQHGSLTWEAPNGTCYDECLDSSSPASSTLVWEAHICNLGSVLVLNVEWFLGFEVPGDHSGEACQCKLEVLLTIL